jgi:uncharacterized protein
MLGLADVLTILSGALVGFTLGLVGGGGSILAVPLLVYVVGLPSAHVAIGTSAVAVAASAAANLIGHARAGNVKWSCAVVFAGFGTAGAAGGAALGKMIDGGRLLAMFGFLMVMVGLLMLRPRRSAGDAGVRLTVANAPRLLPLLIGFGLGVGMLSGFFGIGGGFLIVPALVGATAMPLICAIGSSLVAVTAFAVTTAVSYAVSGLVDWRLAILFVIGGAAGGSLGFRLGARLAGRKRALSLVFSAITIAVGIYVVGAATLTWAPPAVSTLHRDESSDRFSLR